MSPHTGADPIDQILDDVYIAAIAAKDMFGDLNLPDGTATSPDDRDMAEAARRTYRDAWAAEALTWRQALDRDVADAFATAEDAELRTTLISVAATATAWIEAIDRRRAAS